MLRREHWSAGSHMLNGMEQVEHELSLHLERAHELGARAQRSNDAVEEQLRLTRQLADTIRDATEDL